MNSDKSIRAENFKELADLIGIVRPANATESKPSVEIKNLSSGAVQVTCKIYNDDAYEAMRICEDIYNQLKQRYDF